MNRNSFFLLSFFAVGVGSALFENENPVQPSGCQWRHNVTDTGSLSYSQIEVLENCLYYYIAQAQPSQFELINDPPWEFPLTIKIDSIVIYQVDLLHKTSSQFNIHGALYLSWHDTRLEWNDTEWKMKNFALHDNHHIWTPSFNEDSECSQNDACMSKISDVEIYSDGNISAKYTFRYPSFCQIDYRRYPEETNDCCLHLSAVETERKIRYDLKANERAPLRKEVSVTVVEMGGGERTLKNIESSVWSVSDRVIDVVKLGGSRGEFLRLCVHGKKEMSTLRIALRIPATIGTLLMLCSPLFGDLKIQSFVKLCVLFLQTICFLYVCSIAPENGFQGTKPKLYTFYEFLFFLSFLSIVVTLVALALCRVNRTVPPGHFLFLAAKLVNRFFCCIEPESNSYQRHLDDGFDSNRGPNGGTTTVDYTHEWRQIYIAANNLFSGVAFSLFCFVIIFEIM